MKAIPTGSADPFGLRHAALGVVNGLIATQTDFSVRAGLAAAAKLQPAPVSAEATAETATFVERRLQGVLADQGFAFDVVEAVLAVRGDNPTAAVRACAALSQVVGRDWWGETFTAYARCARIAAPADRGTAAQPGRVHRGGRTCAARRLCRRRRHAEAGQGAGGHSRRDAAACCTCQSTPLSARVLVNAEDETLRRARLALVQRIAQLPAHVADLSKLQGF